MLRADLLTPRMQPALNELKIIRKIFQETFHLYKAMPSPSKKTLLLFGSDCIRNRQSPRENFVELKARTNYQATIFGYREYFYIVTKNHLPILPNWVGESKPL